MFIGVFDSGYGGLTILKDFLTLLPEYDYIYLGDNARAPYGTRSFETVYQYSLQAVRKLFELDAKLVIIACNTASAKALRTIQQKDLIHLDPERRVLGVIRPSVEVLQQYTKTKKVGILATPGTVKSKSYVLEIRKLYPDINVYQQACPMWVPLVEYGEYDSEGADYFVEKCVKRLLEQNSEIDTVILACTHYPLLLPKIRKFMPRHIKILSQGPIVAESLKDYLKRHTEIDRELSRNGRRLFLTTDIPDDFDQKASRFIGTTLKVRSQKVTLL